MICECSGSLLLATRVGGVEWHGGPLGFGIVFGSDGTGKFDHSGFWADGHSTLQMGP